MKTYLSEFTILRPEFCLDQAMLLPWTVAAHVRAEERASGALGPEFVVQLEEKIARFACKPAQISSRGTDVPDVAGHQSGYLFASATNENGPAGVDILHRHRFYTEKASGYFERFYEKATPPEHIIHVTCTGYVSPSSAQTLVSKKGWQRQTDVTHAYHMGCYASLPAIRIARGAVATGQLKIDVVHTEMCTLHFNPSDHRPEQLVVQSLFGDGHIKYSVSKEHPDKPGFEVLEILEWIVPESAHAMTWIPTPWGMQMSLAREVPDLIAQQIKPFLETLLRKADVGGIELLSQATFAIHPGGPKIVDGLAQHLELKEAQVSHSRGVLRDFGNMSSATLPHVWSRIADDPTVARGQIVISLAFGPGLTIFGSVMRKT